MRSPRRPIGAGGWFLRAYAAGFGAVFGVMSAVFIGGVFYMVLAGIGTLLTASDGNIELDFGGSSYTASSPASYPSTSPALCPQPYPSAPACAPYGSPSAFDPYQTADPSTVSPPTYSPPPVASIEPAPVASFVPVESPVEASYAAPVSDEPVLGFSELEADNEATKATVEEPDAMNSGIELGVTVRPSNGTEAMPPSVYDDAEPISAEELD